MKATLTLVITTFQNYLTAELESRILDISGGKSGHFEIVAITWSIFGQKWYNDVNLWHISTPNDYNWLENRTMCTYCFILWQI